MQKTIGLIGGVSWESTAIYYQLINQAMREKFGGLNSAKLIINSLNYAPIVQLELESNWDAVTEILIKAATALEKSKDAAVAMLDTTKLHAEAAICFALA